MSELTPCHLITLMCKERTWWQTFSWHCTPSMESWLSATDSSEDMLRQALETHLCVLRSFSSLNGSNPGILLEFELSAAVSVEDLWHYVIWKLKNVLRHQHQGFPFVSLKVSMGDIYDLNRITSQRQSLASKKSQGKKCKCDNIKILISGFAN